MIVHLFSDIEEGSYSVVLTTPEALQEGWWSVLLESPEYLENVILVAVDEAHTAVEW